MHRRLLGVEDSVDRALAREAPLLTGAERSGLADRVEARMRGLGPLEPLLADPEVTEVMVNGPGPVWVEREGRLSVTPLVLDRSTIEHVVERVVAPLGLRADRTAPLVDARLPDGSRVNVALPPTRRRRSLPHDPALRRPHDRAGRRVPTGGRGPARRRRGPPGQRRRVRRIRGGEDHPAQRAGGPDPDGRADPDRRGRGRALAAGRPRRAARGPARQRRAGRRGDHPRPRAQRPAHASGPDRGRRGAGRRRASIWPWP